MISAIRNCRSGDLHCSSPPICLAEALGEEEEEEEEGVYVLHMYLSISGRYVELSKREEIVERVRRIVAI